jgi:hypothetical protein
MLRKNAELLRHDEWRAVGECDETEAKPGFAAAAAEVTARSSTLTLLGFVDLERATAKVLAIERLHGARGIGARHLDETEATRAAGFAIVDQGHLVDGAMGSKKGAHGIFGGSERKISNVKFRHRTTHRKKRYGDRLSALPAGGSQNREGDAANAVSNQPGISKPPRTVQDSLSRRDCF